MEFFQDNIINLVIFFPTLAALVLFFVPEDSPQTSRRLALLFSFVPLALVISMWVDYNANFRGLPGYAFEYQTEWFPLLGSTYYVGLDGISLSMFLLTTLLTPLAILASFNIEDRARLFMILFLLMETAMLGLFGALDLLIFFVFWEFSLVPMYFLIRIWGGADKVYASFKFMIYTMAGSLGLLLAVQVMGLVAGTYSIPALYDIWVNMPEGSNMAFVGVPVETVKWVAYIAFFIAFAIKVPIWPFHTWLPDAHTQAPTAGSMILAGVLLKLGAYGFIRLVIPFFPQQAHETAFVLALLGMLSIVFGGYAAFGQWDFKRLVAYSSINHMGFVVLGIAVMAFVYGLQADVPEWRQDAIIATNGAIFQMFNHGLSAAAMFFLVGVIYERTHTRDLKKMGGLWTVVPVYGTILLFTSMASLGLPGLNGFVSEFMVVRGSMGIFPIYVALSMLGLLMTGAYILKGLHRTLHGPTKPEWKSLQGQDMTLREHLVIWPLMVLMLSLGIWPQWVVTFINDTVVWIFS